MATRPRDLVIDNLKGGMSNTSSSHALPDDMCVLAENVEFLGGTLGERRKGMDPIDLENSNLDSQTHIVHLTTYTPPMSTVLGTELWAISATPDDDVTIAQRVGCEWEEITPDDDIWSATPDIYHIQSHNARGKLFFAYKSAEDRTHVWDGTYLRRVGFATPGDAPTAADSGGAGSFTGQRLYRIRYVEVDADDTDVVLRRSEPSPELEFDPSGTNASVTITRPDLIDEHETHWEIEASDGTSPAGLFYRLSRIAIATTTYVDTNTSALTYADNGTLSEDLGAYEAPESVKFITSDQDRMVFGGSWEVPDHGSRIWWTPVANDSGVGNDERVPTDTDNYVDLDWQTGGDLTGLSAPIAGSFYAFKYSRIYKLQRTGDINNAYEQFLLSDSRGAIPHSIINGVDEYGRGCVYFLDPAVGPCRVGAQGLQQVKGLRATWKRVNSAADKVVCHGVYYPDKQQVRWWVAVDSAESPNLMLVLQCNEIRSTANGTERGWSIFSGQQTLAYCSTILPEPTIDDVSEGVFLSYRPYAGFLTPYFIQRCDVYTTDAGIGYTATIITKPYIVAGLNNKWGAMRAALLAKAIDATHIGLKVSFIRDYGKEENFITTEFTPEASEEIVNKEFDDLRMSEAFAIQVKFTDDV